MSTIDFQQLTKLYYSIGEVAEMFGVNTSLLRFWEKEFELKVSKKNKKGNRLYSVKEIEEISRIYDLVKGNGFTLDGAKKALKKYKTVEEVQPVNEIVTRLENVRSRLLKLKKS